MLKSANFEEALKATGYGKFNIALVIISGACLFTVNADLYSTGYILSSAQCDLNLTIFDKGLLTSITFIGVVCSSHFWGYLADTKGRKNIIIITLFISFCCTVVGSFAASFWLLTSFRFFSGFFISGASTSIYAYLGEFHSNKYRTISITCASLFIAFAILALPAIAWLVIPQQWTFDIFGSFTYKPWRIFLVLCSLPGVFTALLLLFFPESPKFLLAQGRNEEALDALKRVYAFNSGKDLDTYPINVILEMTDEKTQNRTQMNLFKSISNQTLPLFKMPHLISTFIVCTLQWGLFAVSSGLLLWYPDIVNKLADNARLHPNTSITVCQSISVKISHENQTNQCFDGVDDSVFEQNLLIGIGYVIGTLVINFFVNILGKKTLLIIFLTFSGSAGVALYWITNRIIINGLFVGLLVLSGISVFILNAAVVEMFPTYLRAMAMSISLMSGRIGSILFSSIIGILIEHNCVVTFIVFSVILFVSAILSWWIPNFSIESTN